MNYGRFFKLNQDLSWVVKGVTVFDYTELPAFEGKDANTSMSPKYPISMSVTANAVRFKMHYCVYRSTNKKRQQPNPIYGYSVDDIKQQLHELYKNESYANDKLNIVHMEEVILELPFSGIGTNGLTDIIKKTYIAAFPQVAEMEEIEKFKEKDDTDRTISKLTGNQYLKKLIEERILGKEKNPDAISFSTLWLMDLYQKEEIQEEETIQEETIQQENIQKGETIQQEDQTKEKDIINLCSNQINQLIDKFLRKLLLDFMFDLKHSELFQVCPRYDQMYSGLMSNFYFSALMHKCEYYYYRDLTIHAIKDYDKKKQEKKVGKFDEKKIIYLYAKELFDAEEQWANDIRNPLSDKLFGQSYPDDFSKSGKTTWWGEKRTEIRSVLWERMTIKHWDSWFASPEEEMRRIYFISKADKRKTACNSVSLTEYLHLTINNTEDKGSPMNAVSIKKELMSHASVSRSKSSKWFLNRYDYNDALHMHLFKASNLVFTIIAFIMVLLLYINTQFNVAHTYIISLGKSFLSFQGIILILVLPFLLGLILFCMYKYSRKQTDKYYNCNPLVPIYHRFAFKKLWLAEIAITFFFCMLSVLFIYLFRGTSYIESLFEQNVHVILIAACIILFVFFVLNYLLSRNIIPKKWYIMSASIHPIKSWHMFLPKLTASITAAWIPLTTGYKNYAVFLQSDTSIVVLITIALVVMVFFLYLVNYACPSCSSWVKVLRSFEQLLISFCISLTIGAICLSLKTQGQLSLDMITSNQLTNYLEIWINLSLIAMFVGLFLNAIFRPKNQMTDI